ncbi:MULTISPECIES: MFS transporter [Pseudoalteromonas]|jgi:MFS family permease|uniref:MFS transporter n=1 Tax=Pseudoalteromonas neustonica TaxID=1840331 RepID=A0ABY3F8J6_9GAMM|nr:MULTISPECIES: MFS transporter [Pseudoalteromonas]MBB1292587.1 MFS transporter [Pseudoalteromonas sp. SR41-4]MBB1308896.1 MFS transporter [Pseudoalteromonas sp. SR41-8]MBB1408198.1 MFS transporter [Pseudoalteromonas sp. SG44-17]MBB1505659.1 MFS transporter [Pseudoalteromonas sp. SG41-1]TVU80395.1 MFS transporter [Pseudoalteromonas neustonica]|tara:strand:+ start:6297 stop:7658 length:1362 start_codon:yes stop_codon:yes gene_type:complete
MKSFPSLYFANLFLIIGTGLLTTYLALYLGKNGISTFWIGLMTSCYYMGLLLGSKLGYHLIKSVGHIRTFAASTAAVLACVAAHGVSDNIYLWLALRLFVGLGMMCNYMVLESWLNEQAAPESRGRVFSFYMITSYLGMILGQFALAEFPELGYAPLFLVCMALAIGIIPISITRRIHPKPLKPIQVSLFDYFKKVPQSLTAVHFAGIINGSFYGLAPTFAKSSGFNSSEIAIFMSATIFAGLIAQWPMGILSDKIRRSVLIRTNAVAIGVVSLALFLLPITQTLAFALTFMFGLFAFTLYPLSSALANSRVEDEERVGVSSALLVVFGAGAALGSTANAQVMTYFGHQALYASIALLTVIMYLLLTYINSKQKVEQPESSDYVVGTSDVTNSPLAATMDPRIEETTAHEQMLVVDEIDDEYEENNAVFDTDDPQGDLFKDFQTQDETAELKK